MWSGTDYLKNTNEFTHPDNIASSTDWSYNGQRSLKLTRRSESYNDYITTSSLPTPKGDYIFSCKVYSPSANGRVSVFLEDKDAVVVGYVISNDIQSINISINDSEIIAIRFIVDTLLQSAYFDDINVTSQ